MKYRYFTYSLAIESELLCPYLPKFSKGKPDVIIKFGRVSDSLTNPLIKGFKFEAKRDQILLKTNFIADFLISNGNIIIIQPKKGARNEEIRLLLFGWVFGALLHQRNLLPLHGSAIKACDEGVVFCGASGIGKSTIARGMLKRGYQILDDNVAVVSITNGAAQVHPGYPEIKVWKSDLRKEEIDKSQYRRALRESDKVALKVTDHFYARPLPVKRILILEWTPKNAIEISLLAGKDKIKALRDNTFCLRFVKGLGKQLSHFKLLSQLGQCVQIFQIRQPYHPSFPDILLDKLEKESFYKL